MFSCPKYWSLEIRIFDCKQKNEFVTDIDGDCDNIDDDAEADDAYEACVATWPNERRRDHPCDSSLSLCLIYPYMYDHGDRNGFLC